MQGGIELVIHRGVTIFQCKWYKIGDARGDRKNLYVQGGINIFLDFFTTSPKNCNVRWDRINNGSRLKKFSMYNV